MDHRVVAVLIDYEGEPHFRCACWLVFSGKTKGIWSIALSAGGTRATCTPSVHLPGHLHEFSSDVPIVKTWKTLALRPEYHAAEPSPCDVDCACRTVAA
jgi:hypothetical protein